MDTYIAMGYVPGSNLGRASRVKHEHASAMAHRYGPMIYRRALVLLGNPDDAQDAVQEVLLRALRGEAGFEKRAQISTWLYSITTHYCLNLIRNRSRQAQLRAQHLPPEAALKPGTEALLTVRALLQQAELQEAKAVTYVYLDGMPRAEAAELMGVSVRTIGNLLHSFQTWAREKLQELDRSTEGSEP